METSRLTRDGTTAEPFSRDYQFIRHERGQGNIHFPIQLTTCRTGNLTRLVHTLTIWVTIHSYIIGEFRHLGLARHRYSHVLFVSRHSVRSRREIESSSAAFQSVLTKNAMFLKAPRHAEIRNVGLPRSEAVEALSRSSWPASQHPTIQSHVHFGKQPLESCPFATPCGCRRRRQTLVGGQLSSQKLPCSQQRMLKTFGCVEFSLQKHRQGSFLFCSDSTYIYIYCLSLYLQ